MTELNTNEDDSEASLPNEQVSVTIDKASNNAIVGANYNIGGEQTFNNFASYSSSEILVKRSLMRVSSDTNFVPSGLQQLLDILKKEHLILLEAPQNWGHEYLAENLAAALIKDLKFDLDEVLSHIGQLTGRTILDALQSQKMRDEDDEEIPIQSQILYLPDAKPESYTHSILSELQDYGKKNAVYTILLSRENRQAWGEINKRPNFVSLQTQEIYSNKDYAAWAADVLNNSPESLEKLAQLGILKSSEIELNADSPLSNLDSVQTLLDFVQKTVKAPSTVPRLPSYIKEIGKAKDLIAHIQDAAENQDKRLKDWFNNLAEDERYMVLTVSLVNNISQQTFWAIYERLIDARWRKRNRSLRMTDYLEIESRLEAYIHIENDQISFREDDTRKSLIIHVLSSYRRSLVNALPEIARLLTESEQSPVSSEASLNDDIASLEIWGSDLAPDDPSNQGRTRLRDSLIASIIDIDQHEPVTTNYILQAWAERPLYPTDGNTEIALPIASLIPTKRAFSDVLLKMYQREESSLKQYWERRSLRLVQHWYRTIRQDSASFVLDRDKRRRQISRSLVFTLCKLAENLNETEFGVFELAGTLLTELPAQQPKADELQSLWHMLAAFAWEKDYLTRLTLADWISNLYRSHPKHFRAMILLLSSDWREEVRFQIANLLWQLYRQIDREQVQLVHYLLDGKGTEFVNRKPTDDGHYLKSEANPSKSLPCPHHTWTGTLAIFMIGVFDDLLFKLYLQTYLRTAESDAYRAFEAVAERLIEWDIARQRGVAPIIYYWRQGGSDEAPLLQIRNSFRLVLNDRGEDGLQSVAAKRFATILEKKSRKLSDYLSTTELEAFERTSDAEKMRPSHSMV